MAALVAPAPGIADETRAAGDRADADHSEAYFPSSDGVTMLHADILRPRGLGMSVATPVILTVSPYTNHNGSTTDTDWFGSGPNRRFYDFLDLSGALSKGYTYVMVDLPGTGGSGGCNDWGGAREQAAVHAAVEWAASQPWSTGAVALLGKSYDGWTGLMGVAQQPKGLAAVISMEPVYSGYRYKYMNGVRRPNFFLTMLLFQAIDMKPGRITDPPQYHVSGAPQVWCYPVNMAGTIADDDEVGPYWRERNLIPTAAGKTTPVFLMQGFLETNTKPDGAFEYWNGLGGTHNRAWFGQFDHVRGWEDTGRGGFIDEAMRFLDRHLKGIAPAVADPPVVVQDFRGRYRAEQQWPPADAGAYETTLRTGSYFDDGNGSGRRPDPNRGILTVSPPLPYDVWLSGEPVFTATVDARPNANIAANVYEVDGAGAARMISRGVALARGLGPRTVRFTMYGQDWPVPAGHRIAVMISDANDEEFIHVPTRASVNVLDARIDLPFLLTERTTFLDGTASAILRQRQNEAVTVFSQELMADVEVPFALPPRMLKH